MIIVANKHFACLLQGKHVILIMKTCFRSLRINFKYVLISHISHTLYYFLQTQNNNNNNTPYLEFVLKV